MKTKLWRLKTIQGNIKKFYLQVITDACVKIVVLKLWSETKNKESVSGTIRRCFSGFCQKMFGKKYFRRHFRENRKKSLSPLAGFGQ